MTTDRDMLETIRARMSLLGPSDWQNLWELVVSHLALPPTPIEPKTTPDDKLRDLIGHLRDATPIVAMRCATEGCEEKCCTNCRGTVYAANAVLANRCLAKEASEWLGQKGRHDHHA